MEERRKFVRIKDLKSVEARVDNSNGGMDLVEIKDMSLSGINFYSEKQIEKDRMIKIKIDLPDGLASLNLEGKVLWQLSSLRDKFATGVRFHHADNKVKERLAKFIHEHAKSVNEGREFIRCALDADIVINSLEGSGDKFPAKAIDISPGGMKLSLVNKIDIGARIKLAFFLPQANEAIEVKARVIWVRKEIDKDGFAAGIIYTEMEAAVKDRIVKFIDNYCNLN